MSTPILSLEHMDSVSRTEQDWLFEKLLGKLNSHRHIFLTADPGWGILEYVNELRFQLAEKNPEIHTCFMDIMPVHSSTSFLELFFSALLHRFPDETSCLEIDNSSMDTLRIPELIAKRKKIKIAVFLANAHLFQRFKDPIPFLRTLKLELKYQKHCVYCFYGNDTPYLKDLLHYPGPLSGLGQLFELRHKPLKHRSDSIRKLFHDHKKRIDYTTSINMSYAVDNHPFYLKLLVWHALILTGDTCTEAIVEKSLNNLILHFEYRYYEIAERLTPKQLNLLKALVEGNQKLYSKSIRDKYQLGSTSNIAKIKTSLERKEIINTGRMETVFADPIFREWLRRRYFGRP
ncbi:MAG: hypothetical protein KAI08_01540 [Bacteroidales bacterium]|nr:hypothetical protein [Bacteroidales bacterium]